MTKNTILIAAMTLPLAMAAPLALAQSTQPGADTGLKAVCVLTGTEGHDVRGTVSFTQMGDQVRIQAEVEGLTPGQHGFHIHELGDISGTDGKTAGGHYNPDGVDHGKPDADVRHVGDLGNIEADDSGKATYDRTDSVISLDGSQSILGRAIIIHAKPDDFGQPTGNAGARVAMGVIGLSK